MQSASTVSRSIHANDLGTRFPCIECRTHSKRSTSSSSLLKPSASSPSLLEGNNEGQLVIHWCESSRKPCTHFAQLYLRNE